MPVDGGSEELRLQLAWLRRGQKSLDERLDKIERSLLFRLIRWPGVRHARFNDWLDRRITRRDSLYRAWLDHERTSLLPAPGECLRRIAEFARRPLITVVIVAQNAQPARLEAAIASVEDQLYPDWELCVVSSGADLVEALEARARRAAGRLHLLRSPAGAGVSEMLNQACAQATGEFVGFLGQSDVLSPYALFFLAQALQSASPAILYSDEDQLLERRGRSNPLFKPGWSPDLLNATMYLANFLAVSRQALVEAGAFRAEFEGSHFFDLCLRITEAGGGVVHIPRILYHAREGVFRSRATDGKAIEAAIARRGWKADVAAGAAEGTFRVLRRTAKLASIVVCSRSPRLLESMLRSVRSGTAYANYEVIVAEHCLAGENPLIAALAEEFGCERVAVFGPFNFSALNNRASEKARGDVLVFLNDDVEPLRQDWLENLISHLEQEEIGIVGAKLVYPTGAIQHAGIVLGMGDGAGHVNRHRYVGGYWRWIDEARNVSAVTGACLAIRTALFRELNGFDELFPDNYNDVDLCLRATAAGFRIVYEPAAVLRHYEGQTRTLFVEYDERERFYMRWSRAVEGVDPYYNPNLAGGESPTLAT